jgi:WD40 repeat protein
VDHALWTVRWNPDGSQFAVGGVDALWVFDAATLERASLIPDLPPERRAAATDWPYMAITRLAWRPTRNLLAVSSQGNGVDRNGIYDLDCGTSIPLRLGFCRGVRWSPTGDRLATADSDGHLKIWNIDGDLLHDIPRFQEAIGLAGVAWSPCGDRIVTIGNRITIHTGEGSPIKQIMHRPEAAERPQLILSVEWHPSGKFFAVGDYGAEVEDPILQFWSADGDLLKNILIEGGAEMRNLSWNRDGTLLASASDKLRIWSRDGNLLHEGDSPDLLWGVDWHPDGDRILTTGLDGRVTLWSATAQPIKQIVAPPDESFCPPPAP